MLVLDRGNTSPAETERTGRLMCPTIFDVLHLLFVVAGGLNGAGTGFKLYGYVGGAVGGILGATLGVFVGYTFKRFLDLLLEYRVRRKSTPALKAELVDDYIPGTYVSGLIISVLLERGEPVESFRAYIFRQLRSEHVTWRKAGLYSLTVCYPDLAAELKSFDAFHPTVEDRERLKEIDERGRG